MAMMRNAVAAACVVLSVHGAAAQTSQVCDLLIGAATEGASQRIDADNQTIGMPDSVVTLTCLDAFFNGEAFNLVWDFEGALWRMLTDIAIRTACNLAREAWDATIGQISCGIALYGPRIGFEGSLAGGSFCPVMRIGGGAGGVPLAGASLQAGAVTAPTVQYSPVGPPDIAINPAFALGRDW